LNICRNVFDDDVVIVMSSVHRTHSTLKANLICIKCFAHKNEWWHTVSYRTISTATSPHL